MLFSDEDINMNNINLTNMIINPVFDFQFSTLMLMKCTRRDWAEQFQDGKLYFGTPYQWIEMEKKGKKGQGDLLEGVFLSIQEGNETEEVKNLLEDSEIEHFYDGGYLFFRRKALLNLHCLCIYGIHSNTFTKSIMPNGKASFSVDVPKEYFSDFSDVNNLEDYKHIQSDKQPVVVLVNNPHDFFERIKSFLFSLGVKSEEVIISPVKYIDRYTNNNIGMITPSELLFKDLSFEKQSEVRIVINCNSPKYIDYMKNHNNLIEIGSLRDITDIYDYYFEDMKIQRLGNKSALISLPEKRTLNMYDMDYWELEKLLVSIMLGTTETTGMSQQCKTLNQISSNCVWL